MLGAIIGDIVGSVYEFDNIKTKDFPLFCSDCRFIDDTVMTCAVADALMKKTTPSKRIEDTIIESMREFGNQYRNCSYGGRFLLWLESKNPQPYNSWGNGSAMRVSPVGWLCNGIDSVDDTAKKSAIITHNHYEGIKGAQATAVAIFLARMKYPKQYIRNYTETEYGYDLSMTCDDIRPHYTFDESCQNTVPQAIIAYLESVDFEDAIRNAISLGGDSDTLAAITGSIAEAEYGIPDDIRDEAVSFLDRRLFDTVIRFQTRIQQKFV